jgi:hypothetical protein
VAFARLRRFDDKADRPGTASSSSLTRRGAAAIAVWTHVRFARTIGAYATRKRPATLFAIV